MMRAVLVVVSTILFFHPHLSSQAMAAGGKNANLHGKAFETRIGEVLVEAGLPLVPFADWKTNKSGYGAELVLRNVPFTNIYGGRSLTEFVLRSGRQDLNIRIEAKWQRVHGSVDTKLPYLYHNALEAMPEDHIIVVIDGGGFRPGAVRWLRDAAKHKWYAGPAQSNKTIEVMNFVEFEEWVGKTFP